MAQLFESTTINGMTLKNRFVRSATFEGMAADDGSCTQRLIDLMVELARGGVGLIISSHSYVSPEGREGRWKMGIDNDNRILGLSNMAEAVHREGGKIILQLAHGGCRSAFDFEGADPMGASPMEIKPGIFCREMTIEDIHQTTDAFGLAAARAQKAGFDGVQIHAAHGYLLSQFLTPFYNKRKDSYGGGIENRARIILEVFRRIRASTGDHFPVLLKINSEDFLDKGLVVKEMIHVCHMMEDAGIDAIELSGGTQLSGRYFPARPGQLPSEDMEVYYREAAGLYKEHIKVPLMLVGGIRSFQVAEGLIENGLADYISLCRPLIREPNLVNRWKSGDIRKAACRSDNLCLEAAKAGKGIYCVTEEKLKHPNT